MRRTYSGTESSCSIAGPSTTAVSSSTGRNSSGRGCTTGSEAEAVGALDGASSIQVERGGAARGDPCHFVHTSGDPGLRSLENAEASNSTWKAIVRRNAPIRPACCELKSRLRRVTAILRQIALEAADFTITLDHDSRMTKKTGGSGAVDQARPDSGKVNTLYSRLGSGID